MIKGLTYLALVLISTIILLSLKLRDWEETMRDSEEEK